MDLFALAAKITLDTDNYEKGVRDARTSFSEFSAWTVAKGQIIADAIMEGGKAVASLGKAALDSYADFEQLVGGVETLFKDSSDAVIKNAENAYMTAGMSANEYMETVTNFSASLLQSLGGNTVAAAGIADMAITDMADNANKMGTSMGMIQNAYQGFAKANYTMLDNLKLGYGGTKQEMERLLEDAEKLTGVKFDINNFSDVVTAIHAIQTEIGITGTTAEEAMQTVEGSFNTVKSAWKNLITGLGRDEADVESLTDGFMSTLSIAIDNVLPVFDRFVDQLGIVLDKVVPYLAEKLPILLEKVMPLIIQVGTALAQGLMHGFIEVAKNIFDKNFRDSDGSISWKKIFIGQSTTDLMYPKSQTGGFRTGGARGGSGPIDITLELDGAVLARKQYKYNEAEQRRHGSSMTG